MTMRATTLVGFAFTLLGVAACAGSEPGGDRRLGADSVVISLPERVGALERPAVVFDHGKHAKALEQKCETCHPESKPGELSLQILPAGTGDDRDSMIDGYHGQCGACHGKGARQKAPGPLMCGDCHVKPAQANPARQLSFAGKLHDLHLDVTDKDCATCHHHSDAGATPPPCKACHGATASKDQPSLEEAIHQKCVGCHHKMGAEEGCGTCHERAAKEAGR